MTTLRATPIAPQVLWSRLSPYLNKVGVPAFIDFTPYPVEKTGETFTVLQVADAPLTGTSDYHRTLSRSRVALNIYADHSRADGAITAYDAESKAWAIYEFANPLIDEQTNSTFPEVIDCNRVGEPRVFLIPEAEGALHLTAIYDVTLIGSRDYDYE